MISIKINCLLDATMDGKLLKKVKQMFSKPTTLNRSVASNINGTGEDGTTPSTTDPEETRKQVFTKPSVLSSSFTSNSTGSGENGLTPSTTDPDEND